MLRDVVCKITTTFWYNRKGFRMRCGLLSVCMGDQTLTKRDWTRRSLTEPYGARLPVLFRSPSGGEPRTRQKLQPCSSAPPPNPPPTPTHQHRCRFTILLQLRSAFYKGFPPACRSMTSIMSFCDITPRNIVNTYRRFGATSIDIYGLQGKVTSQPKILLAH